MSLGPQWVNTLRLKQNCYHFAAVIFKHIFVNENCCILIPWGPVRNMPAQFRWGFGTKQLLSWYLNQWCFLGHMCNTMPWWVNMQGCLFGHIDNTCRWNRHNLMSKFKITSPEMFLCQFQHELHATMSLSFIWLLFYCHKPIYYLPGWNFNGAFAC